MMDAAGDSSILNLVEGRAVVIYWSWDSEDGGVLPIRWSRFGKLVH